MGLWIDILNLGADGQSEEARRRLYFELWPTLSTKWVPMAVGSFISRLSAQERLLAKSNEQDFVDYVLDGIRSGIEQTLTLAEICRRQPDATLDALVAMFPWPLGLKCNIEWKKTRLADWLRSFDHAGVQVPPRILANLNQDGEARYPFNEKAYATSRTLLKQSWNDFKTKLDLDQRFISIADTDPDEGTSSETIDYGSVSKALENLNWENRIDPETQMDFYRLGQRIGPEISGLMNKMHADQPKHGYRPIAWHRVFWDLTSEYQNLRLELKMHDPYCQVDDDLCARIETHCGCHVQACHQQASDIAGESIQANRRFTIQREVWPHADCDKAEKTCPSSHF